MKNRLLLFLLAAVTVYAVEPVLKEDFDGTLSFGKLLNGNVEYIDGVNGKAAVLSDAVIFLPGTEKLRFEEGSAILWIKPMNKDQMFPEEAMSTWELNGSPFAPRDRKNATAYDCLRFYDKALTADDIALIYNSERPRVEASIPLKNLRKVYVNLPKLPVSPAVNGTYDDREWAGAVKFPAMFLAGTRNVDLPWYGEVYMGHDTIFTQLYD